MLRLLKAERVFYFMKWNSSFNFFSEQCAVVTLYPQSEESSFHR